MTEKSLDLPQECWELIFNSLDEQRHFESLSLVSRRFLSITNYLRFHLKITDPAIPFLPQLFNRFQNVKKIDLLEFQGDLNSILCMISRSGLDLESVNISKQKRFPLIGLRELGTRMKNLKELNCSKIRSLQDSDLVAISETCSFLEVLDISYPEADSNFLSDRSLDLESSSGFVTDFGILALSGNLKRLNKIDLSVNGIGIPSIDSCFKESFAYARGLCEIDMSNSFISDELLCLLAEACLPLKKLVLSHCYNFTLAGISFVLSKYQSLEYLNLEGANFLDDESMIGLSRFLCSLNSINLGFCSKLTNSTFFTILRDCPSLTEIKMETTNLGLDDFMTDLVVNPRVKSLHLARNGNLSDQFLRRVALLCPNLQMLDVSHCSGITEEGIGEILRSCELKHLEINACRQVYDLGIAFELPKLEVLRALGSGFNDDSLLTVANTCCRILHLDLENCLNVTTNGVREVVENCRTLREINLRWCDGVNIDIVAWMVFSRPSLRKIIPPCGFAPTESQRDFFLRHGCLVCKG
ncbi:putative F-box/LRR-repeat protein [Melia azedarach]|uniref:F-box/LRR-repeat protein n=1 Tax=Melia azedarach TaxID=155640 RepID=A0ACC1Y7L3_MELAZ|nr:putative F-box/LRR-repeat protein [Melia azedarach]